MTQVNGLNTAAGILRNRAASLARTTTVSLPLALLCLVLMLVNGPSGTDPVATAGDWLWMSAFIVFSVVAAVFAGCSLVLHALADAREVDSESR